ncbi:hypothetical protein U0070_018302 [Myodes glareolus]|uniref:Uncharacterized protein n=1 Tax=Myodes glareolus TaxID=447135 RepID=A0AAW0JVK4_MYOGA
MLVNNSSRVKICGAVKKEPSLERPQGSASKATLSVCPCGPGRTGSLQCGHHKRGEGIQRLGHDLSVASAVLACIAPRSYPCLRFSDLDPVFSVTFK